MLDKQLIVLAKGKGANAVVGSANVPNLTPNELYAGRLAYIEGWRKVHRHLREQTDGLSRTINFGSSSWTWLLAAYCPDYWSRVDCCTVDQFGGACLDKTVKPLDEISASGQNDGLVLGINPVSQPAVADRFQRSMADCRPLGQARSLVVHRMPEEKKRILIFGAGRGASTAARYFHADTPHEVVGYAVDAAYFKDSEFFGRPVVPLDDVARRFSPSDVYAFAPMGAARMNEVRTEKYTLLKSLGYRFISYVHSTNDIHEKGHCRGELLHS